MPFMGAFAGVGLLKGILALLTTLSVLDKSGTTYTILYAAADGMFYFLPMFLAYTAGKKFGANAFVSMCIAAAMLYPNIAALQSAGDPVTFIGIPVKLISYSSTVLPIIAATYAQSLLEKQLNKVFPKMIRGLFVPMIVLVVIVPLSFIVIGPVTDFVGNVLAKGIQWLLNVAPAIGGFLIAALWPIMIIFGVHWGVVPIVMNNHATLGYDMILPLTVGCNFGIAAACIAVFLRTRNRDMKQVSGSAAISALIGGITEPGVYGVLMKYKKIFAAMCLFNGIGGIIGGIAHMTRDSMISVNLLTVPAIAALYGPVSLVCIGISMVGTFLVTYLFLYKDVRNTEVADIDK
jgi:PTS system beta-glucosides-specific IIC component